MTKVDVLPIAQLELREGFRWYRERSSRAARRFALEVKAAITAIRQDPERFPSWNDTYRFCILNRFPYYVAYRVASDRILIAEKLSPQQRLQLIARLWESLPAESWPQQSDVELADVSRRLANLGVERTDSVPWPIVERLMADCARSSGNQVFAAPRRFDLSTIFVVTIAFSLLFAGMRLLPFPPLANVIVGGYFALIGLAQAFLFYGNRPRTASMLVGALYYSLVTYIFWQINGPRAYPTFNVLLSAVFVIIFGAVLGFLAGALVGSVFMIADFLRRSMRSSLRHRQPELVGEN